MSDWESELSSFAQDAWEAKDARLNFRTELWETRDGRQIAIKDMDDRHLFNAYRYSQDALLFREMVLRLFENRIKEKST